MTLTLTISLTDPIFERAKIQGLFLETPTFFVGDIHGQHDALCRLLDKFAQHKRQNSHLVFLGDITDRGPDSTACLKTVFHPDVGKTIGATQVTRLWGNHCLMLVESLQNIEKEDNPMRGIRGPVWDLWWGNGGDRFFLEAKQKFDNDGLRIWMDSLGFGQHPGSHLQSLYNEPQLLGQQNRVLAVHAGVDPRGSVDDALEITADQWRDSWGYANPFHWSWMREPFYPWQQAIYRDGNPLSREDSLKTHVIADGRDGEGMLVFHGHTVLKWILEFHEKQDPNMMLKTIHGGGVNLDFGAAVGKFVGGALLDGDTLTLFAEPC